MSSHFCNFYKSVQEIMCNPTGTVSWFCGMKQRHIWSVWSGSEFPCENTRSQNFQKSNLFSFSSNLFHFWTLFILLFALLYINNLGKTLSVVLVGKGNTQKCTGNFNVSGAGLKSVTRNNCKLLTKIWQHTYRTVHQKHFASRSPCVNNHIKLVSQ